MTDEEIEEMLGEESDMDDIEVDQLADAFLAKLRADLLGSTAKELENLREQLGFLEADKAALIQQTIDLRNEVERWRSLLERAELRIERQCATAGSFIQEWGRAGRES